MTTELRTETITSDAGLAGLSGSWDELVREMPRPSPFLLHGWISERWRQYGQDAELAVQVAWRGDRLVGALPLCRRRRFGLRVTEFVGGTRAPLADLMVADDDREVAALLAARAAESSGDLADLSGLPGGSRLAATLPPGSLTMIERLEAPVLDLSAGWDARLSPRARSERRRHRRQLEALGPVNVTVARTAAELEPALEEAFRLHALRWEGRRDSSGFGTPVGKEFHRAALLRLTDQDVPRLVTLMVSGRPIAFSLYLQLERRLYGLVMAFDPAVGRYSPGSEALFCALETAAAEGIRRVEFLGAAAEHKLRLADRLEPIYEGIGLASTLRGKAAVETLTGGIRIRRRIKRSQTAKRLYYRLPRLSRT